MVTIVSTVPHQSVVKEVVCYGCGATLSYVPNEVKSRTHCDYTGDKDTIRFIECPNCRHEVRAK